MWPSHHNLETRYSKHQLEQRPPPMNSSSPDLSIYGGKSTTGHLHTHVPPRVDSSSGIPVHALLHCCYISTLECKLSSSETEKGHHHWHHHRPIYSWPLKMNSFDDTHSAKLLHAPASSGISVPHASICRQTPDTHARSWHTPHATCRLSVPPC